MEARGFFLPGEVVIRPDPKAVTRFLWDHWAEMEKSSLAPSKEWCLRHPPEWAPRWITDRSLVIRVPARVRREERWVIRAGGAGPAGVAEIFIHAKYPFLRPPRDEKSYHLRLYVGQGYRGRRVGVLACIEALAWFWAKHPGERVLIHSGGWAGPSAPSLRLAGPYVGPGVVGLGVVEELRAGRRALAWELVRAATRQGGARAHPLAAFLRRHPGLLRAVVWAARQDSARSFAWGLVRAATRQDRAPHPLAAFLRRYPGLLHVVGRRILAFWCPPSLDVYARALYRAAEPLLVRGSER